MHFLVGLIGWLLIVAILFDGFEAMVLPRRVMRRIRPARLYYRFWWPIWSWLATRLRSGAQRQYVLSFFGPMSLLGLFASWTVGLIFGFGLLQWSLAAPLGNDGGGAPNFATCLYLSGETFFTLGYGDFAPTSWVGRALSVLESGLGFGFMAVVIGYLPVLYQSFSRRESLIALLDARAGSPPTASQLIQRSHQTVGSASAEAFLAEGERWAADLLETHMSFPVLCFYRSQHDNQSWLACLTVLLDTCAIELATAQDKPSRQQTQMTFAMARHAAVDLTLIFHVPAVAEIDRLSATARQSLLKALQDRQLLTDDTASFEKALAELRDMYEPFIEALEAYFMFDLPPIHTDRIAADNWQRSPWRPRTPGIGQLPGPAKRDEHFS
jgi:hypothetical protein